MSVVVRRFFPEVSLRTLIAEPGGIRVDVALERAEKNIDSMRDEGLRAIDEKIALLRRLVASGSLDDLAACYSIADEIFAEAGTLGLAEVSRVAHSFCSLLSAEDLASVPPKAIQVHLDSIAALRSAAVSENPTLRAAVLGELARLSARFAT